MSAFYFLGWGNKDGKAKVDNTHGIINLSYVNGILVICAVWIGNIWRGMAEVTRMAFIHQLYDWNKLKMKLSQWLRCFIHWQAHTRGGCGGLNERRIYKLPAYWHNLSTKVTKMHNMSSNKTSTSIWFQFFSNVNDFHWQSLPAH